MIKLKKFTFVMAILAALVLVAGTASANLINNGSFEADYQASGTWGIYQNLTSWTGGASGIELRNNVAGVAYDGFNYVELDTTRNSLAYQDVVTAFGQQYLLSFAYSPRERVSSTSNGIAVYWNNVFINSFTGNGSNSGNSWELKNLIVTGIGSATTLKFVAIGTSDSYGGSLDAVSLNSVPEPASLILLGLGLMGLAGVRRKLS